MLDLFRRFRRRLDVCGLLSDIGRLTRLELGQTTEDQNRAAEFAAELVRRAGLADARVISFPADGKTEYQDKILSRAWRATTGRLTVLASPEPFADPVVACRQRHPFHLIQGSPATPPGGLTVRIITFEQLLHGEDGEGTLALLPADKRPMGSVLAAALDLGAVGVITDNLSGRYQTPDAFSWVNGMTVEGHWSPTLRNKPYLGFSVSPRTGDFIRRIAWRGPIIARAECDGCFPPDGVHKTVTATLPGKRPGEIWLLAHLSEPLANDNSAGAAAAAAIAGMIKAMAAAGELPPPEFTLRLVFARELHGFAALAETLGGDLSARVLGGLNMDAMPVNRDTGAPALRLILSPPSTKPFFGNTVMEQLAEDAQKDFPFRYGVTAAGTYGDDTSLGDPSVGVPTLWVVDDTGRKLWHNSTQTVEHINPEALANIASLFGAWTAATVCAQRSGVERLAARSGKILEQRLAAAVSAPSRDDEAPGAFAERIAHLAERFAREVEHLGVIAPCPAVEETAEALRRRGREIAAAGRPEQRGPIGRAGREGDRQEDRRWFTYAASITARRLTRGFPYDMAKAPEGTPVMGVMYGHAARVLARMDGAKNLQQLIREVEWEVGDVLSEREIKALIGDLFRLDSYGYIAAECAEVFEPAALTEELRRLGITQGDVLFAHSSLSAAGRIAGGAEAVLDALKESVGAEGALFLPMFTNPYVYFEGTLAVGDTYRPFVPGMFANPCVHFDGTPAGGDACRPLAPERKPRTGALPVAFGKRPDVFRDRHATHSVAGSGRVAAEWLRDIGPFDPPVGPGSVWPRLAAAGAKLAFLGCGLGPATFLHYLEDKLNLPYLGGALVRYREEGGRTRSAWIPSHLGGHRDFYAGEKSRFWQAALERGLRIGRGRFGLGELLVVDCAELERIGLELLRENPDLLLCERAECWFCSRRRLRGSKA